MDFKIIKRYRPEFSKCVNCGATGTLKKYRSRGFSDKLAKLLFFKLFFCKNCQWKGRYFTLKPAKHWFRAILLYIVIIFSTAFIIYYYLEKFI
jgi:hypothetical protein